MASLSRYCCMGCQPLSESADETSRPSHSIFSSYRAAAAHYTRSKSCQSSQRGIKIINLQFRDADNEAGGAGGAGAWPQRQPEQAHKAGTGENIVHDIAKEIHSISHFLRYLMRYRMRYRTFFLYIASVNNRYMRYFLDIAYDIACDIAYFLT